jgi:hypothetical protein
MTHRMASKTAQRLAWEPFSSDIAKIQGKFAVGMLIEQLFSTRAIYKPMFRKNFPKNFSRDQGGRGGAGVSPGGMGGEIRMQISGKG